MQTFVPYDDEARCAAILDDLRLGKQIVECRQIGLAVLGSPAWGRHPAVLMWAGHSSFLLKYANAMHDQWLHRRGKPHAAFRHMLVDHRAQAPTWLNDPFTPPPWWGDERVHLSHRAALRRKNPDHYPSEWEMHLKRHPGYFWPTKHPDYAEMVS